MCRQTSASLWLQCSLQCWNDLNVIASSQVTGASPSEHDPTQSLRPAVDFPADSVRRCSQTDVRPRAETFVCLSPAASAPLSQHVWLHRCHRVLHSFISLPADCYFSFYGSLQETWIIRVTRQTNKDTLVTLQVVQKVSRCRRTGGEMGSTLVFFKSKLQFVLSQDSLLTDLHLWSAVSDISAGSEVIYAVNVATGREDEEIWETTAQSSVITNWVGDICLFKES